MGTPHGALETGSTNKKSKKKRHEHLSQIALPEQEKIEKCIIDLPNTPLESSAGKSSKKKSKKKKGLEHLFNAAATELITETEEANTENGILDLADAPSEKLAEKSSKKNSKKKKRKEPDAVSENILEINHVEGEEAIPEDINEPTLAEKLASLEVEIHEHAGTHEEPEPSIIQPPSANSVHVLLKQALHADDRALLLDCLFNQDEKVIANSVALLKPTDIFKLLDSLISIIESRGAVLVCALPWLRSLLLQHSSRIMSRESSLTALNSLYQLIESRVSTFNSALQLASFLEFLYSGMVDDGADEPTDVPPAIYVDDDDSEEESEDAMDTENEDEGNKEVEERSDLSDVEMGEEMSD